MRNLVLLSPAQTSALAYKSIHSVKANTSNAEIYTAVYSCEIEANEEGFTLAVRHLIRDMQAQRYTARFYCNQEAVGIGQKDTNVVSRDESLPMPMEILLQKINKKLLPDGIKVCKARSGRMKLDRGDFYAINLKGDFLIAKDICPESWGRELGIIREEDTVLPFGHLGSLDIMDG